MTDSTQRSDDTPHHFGPFTTWVSETRSDRSTLLLTSRRVRKRLAPLEVPSADMDPFYRVFQQYRPKYEARVVRLSVSFGVNSWLLREKFSNLGFCIMYR